MLTASSQSVPSDLGAEPSQCSQHPQFAAPIRDRHGQRIHDAEDGHEHGNRNLHVHETEPLIRDSQDVPPALLVREDEDVPPPCVPVDDSLPHLADGVARCHPDVEVAHGVVVPIAQEHAAVHEDRALLVGVVQDDADDGKTDASVRSGNVDQVSGVHPAQLREVLRDNQPLAGGGAAIHPVGIACDRPAPRCFVETVHFNRSDHDRSVIEGHPVVAEHLHAGDARQRGDLRAHRRRKARRAEIQPLRRHQEQVGIQRRVYRLDDRAVAGAGHSRERHDKCEGQHDGGDAARRASRRLDEAVGGERALDGQDPLQQGTKPFRQTERDRR